MTPVAATTPVASIRVFVAFLVARGVFGLVLLATSFRRFAIPWYYPLERRWALETVPHGLAMAWFGATFVALLSALAAAALVWWAFRSEVVARFLSVRGTVLAIARAGALVMLLDFVYFGWTMMHQVPAPLPSDCSQK